MKRRLPDFLLIGAMKSGTTTLWEYLDRHPRVFLSTPKEPQFFSRDSVYERGLDWYASLFADARDEQICGEASTCYSRAPHYGDVVGRIQADLPAACFVYIMRHPVERMYSHYRHLAEEFVAQGQPVPGFEEALESIPEIVDASRYADQISRFTGGFGSDRILCLFLEDLREDPAAELDRAFGFLGLDPVDVTSDGVVRSNESGTALERHVARQRIDWLRSTPPISWVADLLAPLLRGRVRRALMSSRGTALLGGSAARRHSAAIAPMREDTRARLMEMFAEPNQALAELVGRRPDAWSR